MFTHILNIQLWSNERNEIIHDEKLLDEIIKRISNKKITESVYSNKEYNVEIDLTWRFVEWKSPYNHLIQGNLVTDAIEHDCDKSIYFHTERVLEGIEQYLKDIRFSERSDNSWRIIFYLSKPLSTVYSIQKLL